LRRTSATMNRQRTVQVVFCQRAHAAKYCESGFMNSITSSVHVGSATLSVCVRSAPGNKGIRERVEQRQPVALRGERAVLVCAAASGNLHHTSVSVSGTLRVVLRRLSRRNSQAVPQATARYVPPLLRQRPARSRRVFEMRRTPERTPYFYVARWQARDMNWDDARRRPVGVPCCIEPRPRPIRRSGAASRR